MLSELRAWSGSVDTVAMQRLACRCWPKALHPGGLGWSQSTDQLAEDIVIVDDGDGEIAGWAGITQPSHLVMQVAPGRPEVTEVLVGWLIHTATGPDRIIDTYDDQTRDTLTQHGFERVDPPFGYYRMREPGLRAAVRDITAAAPPGYEIRNVELDEADERVETHRAAWRPADLPFNPDQRPDIDEAWTSSFTLETYRRVQRNAWYDPELDLVVVAPDGSLAGCCIGWFDQVTGWVEIEPLGVVPEHRRRGLAVAMCAEVAARTARRGGGTCSSTPPHPTCIRRPTPPTPKQGSLPTYAA